MKILFLTLGYPPYHSGGYELRCKDIALQLTERGHEIEIITNRVANTSPIIEENGVSRAFHEIRSFTPTANMLLYSYQDIRFLDRKINDFAPDIIYLAHVINFTRYIYPFLAQVDIPIVYDEGGNGLTYAWCHHRWLSNSSNTLKKIPKLLIRQLIQSLSRGLLKAQWAWPKNISAFFNNRSAYQEAGENHVPLVNSQIIHSALDLDVFYSPHRQALNTPITILVPGRIERKKGVMDAIDICRHLQSKRIDVKLLIVGKNAEEDYFQEIATSINNSKCSDITIIPQVTHQELANIYQISDICFFPSYHQTGFSRIPLEAMATKCVVISQGGESSSQTIRHGETGYLIEPQNWAAFELIIRSLMESSLLYQKIIEQAQSYVQQHHAISHYIDQIERFISKSVNQQQ